MKSHHPLPTCMLVFYNSHMEWDDVWRHGDEICDQGYQDLAGIGINAALAKKVHGKNERWKP